MESDTCRTSVIGPDRVAGSEQVSTARRNAVEGRDGRTRTTAFFCVLPWFFCGVLPWLLTTPALQRKPRES